MARLTETTRSGTRTRQVLIWGNVVDAVTSRSPIAPVTVRLLDQATNQPYPLAGKVAEDGAFAFYGSPVSAFPVSPDPYLLRIEARAAFYGTTIEDLPEFRVEVDPNQPLEPVPALVARLEDLAEVDPVMVRVFENPPTPLPLPKVTVRLDPSPVFLRGRVVTAEDPAQGVAQARVELIHPSNLEATADGTGRWAFLEPLPAIAAVTLRVTDPTAMTTQVTTPSYRLDYTQHVNELVIIV